MGPQGTTYRWQNLCFTNCWWKNIYKLQWFHWSTRDV